MSTAFTCLVWKEYRARRTLWFLLLLGGFAMYVALRSVGADWTASLALTGVIGICFLAAAVVMAFAGEVDEGTVGLLRMLPCRTRTLMSAKLTAVLAGLVLLAGTMLVMSAMFELFAQLSPQLARTRQGSLSWERSDLSTFSSSMSLICSASLFASLVSRRVMTSVSMAALLVIVIAAATIELSFNTRHAGANAIWIGAASLLLLGISMFVLSRPWHLGKLPRRLTVPDAIRHLTEHRMPFFGRFWQHWLQNCVAQPLSQRRIFSTLALG